MQTLRRIVVGTDFSECAQHALESAIMLANLSLARITLVHVCQLSGERGSPDAHSSQAMDDQILADCGEALANLVSGHARCGVEVTGVLRTGKPSEKLANVAAEVGASVIVIGRHGGGRGPGPEIGSVAECVMRTASRPVLVIPAAFRVELPSEGR
jgi:nucleotide-binding universal stress UspA family protein